MTYKVYIKPENLEVEVDENTSLIKALLASGLAFDFPCGGNGKCGKCRVRVVEGIGAPTKLEEERLATKELSAGIRLACVTKVEKDITIEHLNTNILEHNILIKAEERSIRVEPHLKKLFFEVEQPISGDRRSDWHRLKDSVIQNGYKQTDLKASLTVLRRLPETLREAGNRVTVVLYDNQVLGIEPHNTTPIMLGMAFDIGTTTIVGYLLDIYTGKELSVVSTLNPQTRFGADVVTRVTFANQENDGLNKLFISVGEAINKLIAEAVLKAGVMAGDIYELSFAANTCMHHLFLGISPRNVATAPYLPVVSEPVVLNPDELKININQAGKIFVLSNIDGFVGADTTAVLLATALDRSADIKLIIDIGTNGEIVLGSKDKIVACSAAAGPAFEGAQISSGMRGAVGAIDHVYFHDRLEYNVIGEVKPIGICGSALLDTIAGMLELGMLDKRGKILPLDKIINPAAKGYKDNILEYDGHLAFLLVEADKTGNGNPIMITQDDIRELQLAKGAIAAGVKILMETCGLQTDDIKEVLLAGAFGNYLNPHSACVIGLIPGELKNRIKMIGNAAGTGAKMALLSSDEFKRAAHISRGVKYIELGSYPRFNSIFAQCTYFEPIS